MLCEKYSFLSVSIKKKILWYKEYLKCISYLIDHLQNNFCECCIFHPAVILLYQ